MTPPCPVEVEVLVRDFSIRGYSGSVILKELRTRGYKINLPLIYKIRYGEGIRREAVNMGVVPPPKR